MDMIKKQEHAVMDIESDVQQMTIQVQSLLFFKIFSGKETKNPF